MDLRLPKELKTYTWDEVKTHTRREDCWIVVEREVEGRKRGLVLDVTTWAPKHPGGEMIYDGAGGDCTIMFWSYHPLTLIDNCNSYLNRLVIGEIENYKCLYTCDTPFYRTLKQRVEQKISPAERRVDWRMWGKTIALLTILAFSFWHGWIQGNMWAIVLFGISLSHTGLNMMHDAIHSSYSKYDFLNGLAAFSFNAAGSNYLAYRREHAFGHHAYTNHVEHDTGVTKYFPILRLHDRLGSNWWNKLQHFYLIPLYLIGIVKFWIDLKGIITLCNYPKRFGPLTANQWIVTIAGKVIFAGWYLGHFWFYEWQRALFDCVLLGMLMGSLAVIFFVVNHYTEKAALVTNQELSKHTSDWAMLQVLCSTNFSVYSTFWSHYSGGLNLQIEHHLFPGIIHTRLMDITPIIRDTCTEYGIKYDDQCYPTFWSALFSNFNFVKTLGQNLPGKVFPTIGKPKTTQRMKHA